MTPSLSRVPALAAAVCLGLPTLFASAPALAEATEGHSDLWNLAAGSASTGHATREDRLADFRRAQATRSLAAGSSASVRAARPEFPRYQGERRSPRAFVQHHGSPEPRVLSRGSTSGLGDFQTSHDRSRPAVITHERRQIVVTPRLDLPLRGGFGTHDSRRSHTQRRSFHSGRSLHADPIVIHGNTRGVQIQGGLSSRGGHGSFDRHALDRQPSRSSFHRGSIHTDRHLHRGSRSHGFRSSSHFRGGFGSTGFCEPRASISLRFGNR